MVMQLNNCVLISCHPRSIYFITVDCYNVQTTVLNPTLLFVRSTDKGWKNISVDDCFGEPAKWIVSFLFFGGFFYFFTRNCYNLNNKTVSGC